MPREEREGRNDMGIDERPSPVQTQRQEPVMVEEAGAAEVIGAGPNKSPHAARTRTELVATVSPQQQYVGRDVTLTGRLTADAVGLPNLPIKLYHLEAGLWTNIDATGTDPSGSFAFEIQKSSRGTSSFRVAYHGDATFEPSVSPALSVTYVAIRTAITATASPQQQYVGGEITVTGRLTADDAPVADAPVTLYNADDIIELAEVATVTTDAFGHAKFTVADSTPTSHTYVLRYPGDATFEPSVSPALSVTYVVIPTAITATASPQQQYVGGEITVTGRLTADDAPVADAPVTLYEGGDVAKQAPVATTSTDASGYYQFTLTGTAARHPTYIARYDGDATHPEALSPELSVTYVMIPTSITATASPHKQYVGGEITVTGRLTADDAPVADAPVALYEGGDVAKQAPVATTSTDASGYYQFTLTGGAAGNLTYIAQYDGDTTHPQALSPELSVTYVIIPTIITATASPHKQYVGQGVTITGRLTADDAPLADAPVALYEGGDVAKQAPVATTSTDASGYYQFTLTGGAAGNLTYIAQYDGDTTHPEALSPELSVTYVMIPTAITAAASPHTQYVGQDVTITGRLTAGAIGLKGTAVTLCRMGNALNRVSTAQTSTDGSGHYKFTLRETVTKSDVYEVRYAGDSAYAPAESIDILVRYAPRSAEAAPLKTRFALNLAWYEILSILLIFAGEGLLFAGYPVRGVAVQMVNILAVAVVVVALNVERVRLIEALALVSMFRVVNLSFALVPTVTIYWIAIVYGVMFLPIVSVIVHEKMNRRDLGIDNVRRSVLLVPLGIVVGTGFALTESAILGNHTLIPNASVPELIQLSIVMIFFVALVEALLFFVLLQPQLIERSGVVAGILITSVIFGAMHAGFANVYELLFATGAGVVLGGAFYKTRSLALVVTILAVNNIILFGALGFFRL